VVQTQCLHERDGGRRWRRLSVTVPGCTAFRDCAHERQRSVPGPRVAAREERATTRRDRGSRVCG